MFLGVLFSLAVSQVSTGASAWFGSDRNSGMPFAWEGSFPGGSSAVINSATGNRCYELPLIGWTQRGGLPVGISLYANSLGRHETNFGRKWGCNYDMAAYQYTPNVTPILVRFGDGRIITYTASDPSTGIYYANPRSLGKIHTIGGDTNGHWDLYDKY